MKRQKVRRGISFIYLDTWQNNKEIDWGQNEIVSVFNSEDIDLTELQRLQLAIQHYLSLQKAIWPGYGDETDSEEEVNNGYPILKILV